MRDREKKYGITPEDYNAMLEEQDNKCKICLVKFNHTPHIDHCHRTGKIRSLLCRLCNTGLGFFKEDIKVLTKAINYLEEHNEPIKK